MSESNEKPCINGYQYQCFTSLSWAVFNTNAHGARKARKAVIDKFGLYGWGLVKDRMKTGVMEIFQHPQIPETKLYAEVMGEAADRR